jgi:hypothetical protein
MVESGNSMPELVLLASGGRLAMEEGATWSPPPYAGMNRTQVRDCLNFARGVLAASQ